VILDSEIDMFTTINQFTGKTLEQHWSTSVWFNRTTESYNYSQWTRFTNQFNSLLINFYWGKI